MPAAKTAKTATKAPQVHPATVEAIEARTDLKIEKLRGEMKEGFSGLRDEMKSLKIWYLASVISIGVLLYFR